MNTVKTIVIDTGVEDKHNVGVKGGQGNIGHEDQETEDCKPIGYQVRDSELQLLCQTKQNGRKTSAEGARNRAPPVLTGLQRLRLHPGRHGHGRRD